MLRRGPKQPRTGREITAHHTMTTDNDNVQVDLSAYSDRELIEAMYNKVVLQKRPYTAHPLWTPEEATSQCMISGTPVPEERLVLIAADDGNQYWVHPGLQRMMQENEVDIFPLEWSGEIDPSYLETPPKRRGRPPGEAKAKVERPDMDNWTIDDVPIMLRKELMRAAKESGITALVSTSGASFLKEPNEWLRDAVLAKLNDADHLPAFMAEDNKHHPVIKLHKPVAKTAPPVKGSPARAGKAGPVRKGVVTSAPVATPGKGRPPLKR